MNAQRPPTGADAAEIDRAGRIVPEATTDLMGKEEALQLTAKCKGYFSQTWTMLADLHRRRGYVALGYDTFADYLNVEFDVSRAHGYRLLDAANVVAELTEAAGMSPTGDTALEITEPQERVVRPRVEITEREARRVKPHIKVVKEQVADSVAAGMPAPEAVRSAVESVVEPKPPTRWEQNAAAYKKHLSENGEAVSPTGGNWPWKKPRRGPWTDDWRRAMFQVDQAMRRLDRLCADDRFERHRSDLPEWPNFLAKVARIDNEINRAEQ